MSGDSLERLRALQRRVEPLKAQVVEELRAYLHEKDRITFRRLPTSVSKSGDVNVTTTCTALMALAVTKRLASFYPNGEPLTAFKKVVETRKWVSSKLEDDNAFTTTMVLR